MVLARQLLGRSGSARSTRRAAGAQ